MLSIENTKFQPITKSPGTEISAKLSLGIPAKEVWRGVRKDLDNREVRKHDVMMLSRPHLFKRSTFSSINRQMKYRRRLHPDGSTSVFT